MSSIKGAAALAGNRSTGDQPRQLETNHPLHGEYELHGNLSNCASSVGHHDWSTRYVHSTPLDSDRVNVHYSVSSNWCGYRVNVVYHLQVCL